MRTFLNIFLILIFFWSFCIYLAMHASKSGDQVDFRYKDSGNVMGGVNFIKR